MRFLFVGGTGIISSAVSPLVVARGHELTLVNRGLSPKATAPAGAEFSPPTRTTPPRCEPPLRVATSTRSCSGSPIRRTTSAPMSRRSRPSPTSTSSSRRRPRMRSRRPTRRHGGGHATVQPVLAVQPGQDRRRGGPAGGRGRGFPVHDRSTVAHLRAEPDPRLRGFVEPPVDDRRPHAARRPDPHSRRWNLA